MTLANWRTTLFGTITLAAAFLTQYPDLLSALLDPATAKKVASVAALLSGFITFANAKDRQVSGNGTVDDPNRVPGEGGRSITLPAILVFFACALSACSTADRSALGHRLRTDAEIAAAAAAAGASQSVLRQWQGGGELDASQIGSAAAQQAVVALIQLDLARAAANNAAPLPESDSKRVKRPTKE